MELVSLNELALRLEVDPQVLVSVGMTANVMASTADTRTVPLAKVPELLAAFRTAHARPHEGWDVPEWLDGSDDPVWRVIAEQYREPMTRPASLPPSQGRQLYELILTTAPKQVVEIGSFLGLSTLWIASALRTLGAGRVHAVDPFGPRLPFAKTHCGCVVDSAAFVTAAAARAGIGHIVALEPMRSQLFAQQLRARQARDVDFLFIDGNHSVGGCLDDFVSYYPHVRRGGHILLHDIHPARCGWLGPRFLLDHFLIGNPQFEVREIVTEPDYGMAIITKLTDRTSLSGLERLKAAMRVYPHRAVQTFVNNGLLRRVLKPLLNDRKLKRAKAATGSV